MWAALAALCVPRARAQSVDDERARVHFVAGNAYYEQARFREAAHEFAEAYQLSGRPEMLINRARAEERAGDLAQAIASLELLFDRHPQTSYKEEAEVQLARLRALPPERPPEPEAPAPSVPAAVAPGPRADRAKLWPPRLPTLIAGGTLIVSALVSVGTGWAAHAKYRRLDGDCEADGACPAGFEQDKQRGQRLARTSTGFTFVAVALAAATSVLWVYDVRARRTQLALGVRSHFAGAAAELRWVY